MKHVFKSTKITQLKVFGPPLILDLEFTDFPSNPMYVELSKWPANITAKEVKNSLIEMGAEMYLVDNNGDSIGEIHEDHSTLTCKCENILNVHTSN